MPDDTLLSVEELKVYFPVYEGVFRKKTADVKAVDNVSFHIKRGEIFGLVGESGCGKTTIGRSILNLIHPTSGTIVFDNELIFSHEQESTLSRAADLRLKRKMQIIFQDPYASLNPKIKVGPSIVEGVLKHKLLNKKEAKEHAIGLLEQCGLHANSYDKYPHEFSGGQRQRICIARAIAMKPEFVIGDEPIAALDVSIQAQILSLLQTIIKTYGLTFLFISHDLHVVRYFCDRVAVMYLGTIVEMGDSEAIFSNPFHPYSQALLSAVPSGYAGTKKERVVLTGDVPSPRKPPSGCKFHTRCPKVMKVCKTVEPLLLQTGKDTQVSCHLYTQ